MLDFGSLIYRIPAFLFAIAVHEYAHAQCADSLGDPTSRYSGRLTLNPMAHMDILGGLLLVLCGFGWAKPVEINPRYFKNPQSDMLKVSLAGPAANLFLCFLAVLLWRVMARFGLLTGGVKELLWWLAQLNVWFAFFNLLPIPPLDGSRIVTMLLPPKQAWDFENFVGQYGMYILIALVFTGVTSAIITPLSRFYLNLVSTLLGFII